MELIKKCFAETKNLILNNGNYVKIEGEEYVQVDDYAEEIYDVQAAKVENGKIYFYNEYMDDWILFNELHSLEVLCGVNEIIKRNINH